MKKKMMANIFYEPFIMEFKEMDVPEIAISGGCF
jgi:hypothetical protein